MSERHEAGQPWEEFIDHLDSEHWGSRNPAFIPADEPLPEEFEPTLEGVVYLNALSLIEAKASLALTEKILDRILEQVRDGR